MGESGGLATGSGDAGGPGAAVQRFWWVNQNQTHRDEIAGGFLWSPKRNKNGAYNRFYENMTFVEPGDLVFSFYDTRIQQVGVVTARAEPAPKPAFTSGGTYWDDEGWFVNVEFKQVRPPVRPKEFIGDLLPWLPEKYSPLRSNGDGLQSVYLAEVGPEFASVLLERCNLDPLVLRSLYSPEDRSDEEIRSFVAEHPGLVEVEKKQLINARRGQGIFKANVRQHERRCRVTGTSSIAHLRASHIKPWSVSTTAEKLNGSNGLLLAPHADHLFDQGWISFADRGEVLVAKVLEPEILDRWGIDTSRNVGTFTKAQSSFLEYHRDQVFKGSASA